MAQVLYSYTTEDAEEALGRKLAPGEAQRLEKAIGHSSIGSVMAGVVDMFRGPDDWADEDEEDVRESLRRGETAQRALFLTWMRSLAHGASTGRGRACAARHRTERRRQQMTRGHLDFSLTGK